MNSALSFVLSDAISLNPIDNTAQIKPPGERLYEEGVERLKRREEERRRQEIERMRGPRGVGELSQGPRLCPKSKEIVFRKGHRLNPGTDERGGPENYARDDCRGHHSKTKSFYEYNKEWKQQVENKVEFQRDRKQRLHKLKVEEEKARIKRELEEYLKNNVHGEQENSHQASERFILNENGEYSSAFPLHLRDYKKNLANFETPVDRSKFVPEISTKSKKLQRQGKVEDRLIQAQRDKIEAEKLAKETAQLEQEIKEAEEASLRPKPKLKTGSQYSKSRSFLQKRNKKLVTVEEEMHRDNTFKPTLQEMPKRLEKKVAKLRGGYDLAKGHSYSPIKSRNKKRVMEESEKARIKYLEEKKQYEAQKEAEKAEMEARLNGKPTLGTFEERQREALIRKDQNLSRLRQELREREQTQSKWESQSRQENARILSGVEHTCQRPESTFKNPSELGSKAAQQAQTPSNDPFLSRQQKYQALKEARLKERVREKEEREFIEGIRFVKATSTQHTEDKYLNERERGSDKQDGNDLSIQYARRSRKRGLDSSAKTALCTIDLSFSPQRTSPGGRYTGASAHSRETGYSGNSFLSSKPNVRDREGGER